jgi:hypothetical protein
LSLAREFIGLSSDFSGRSRLCFVSNANSVSVARLLAAKGAVWHHDVHPTDQGSEPLRNFLRSTMRDYKARA